MEVLPLSSPSWPQSSNWQCAGYVSEDTILEEEPLVQGVLSWYLAVTGIALAILVFPAEATDIMEQDGL